MNETKKKEHKVIITSAFVFLEMEKNKKIKYNFFDYE